MRLQQIRSLTEDIRFYYKRLRNNKDELEPRRKSKVAPPPTEQHQRATRVLINTNSFSFLHLFQVANIYFDASLQCGDHCYVGLPFVLKCKFFFRSVCKQGCTESQSVHWKQLLRFLSEEKKKSPTLFLSENTTTLSTFLILQCILVYLRPVNKKKFAALVQIMEPLCCNFIFLSLSYDVLPHRSTGAFLILLCH